MAKEAGPVDPILRAGVTFTSEPSPTWELPFVADVRVAHEVKTGLVTIADFDFRRPDYALVYRAESAGPGEAKLERYSYALGSALADVPAASNTASDTPVADDQSRARADEHQGYGLAERRLQAVREDRRRVELGSSLLDLSPGAVFTIAGAPRPEIAEDQRLLVTRTQIDGRVDQAWAVRVVAAFAVAKVRPPRRVSWPRVDGIQSAVVVGPPGEEIYSDEFGRVRVRFHWDREGGYDDHRSAWVRVDDSWAGGGFGMIAIPRLGQEVLVAFYEGNPDQPVIVGRVHGGSNPTPAKLPAAMAQSTWRTSSSPKSAGYNELSFDDTAGRERLTLRAEHDLEKVVVREEIEEIHGDRISVVGAHLGTTIGVEDSITVVRMHELRMATITDASGGEMGQPDLALQDTRREIIAKRITISTGGATIVLDGPNITITAQHEVRIKAGGTVVIQGQPYVQINPPLITKRADATPPVVPSDHLVSFRLVSEGRPLAGARVHVEHADGTTSARQVTDGAGQVRLPVSKSGPYLVKRGDPPGEGVGPCARRGACRARDPRGADAGPAHAEGEAHRSQRADCDRGPLARGGLQVSDRARHVPRPCSVDAFDRARGTRARARQRDDGGRGPLGTHPRRLVPRAGSRRSARLPPARVPVRRGHRRDQAQRGEDRAARARRDRRRRPRDQGDLRGRPGARQHHPHQGGHGVQSRRQERGEVLGRGDDRRQGRRPRLALPAHVLPRVRARAGAVQERGGALRSALRRRHRAARSDGGRVEVANEPDHHAQQPLPATTGPRWRVTRSRPMRWRGPGLFRCRRGAESVFNSLRPGPFRRSRRLLNTL